MTTKYKIGIFYDDTLDKPDGVPQYVLTLGGWLSAQGHEVHYLVGQTTRTDIPHIHSLARNVAVRFNGNRLSLPLPISKRRLRAVLDQGQFDIVHVQVPYSPILAGRLIKLLPPAAAVIGTFHVLPYTKLVIWGNRLLAVITRRTDKRFDAMISSTKPCADFAKAVYHFDSTIIPHPVQLAHFQPQKTPASIPTILFLGRLVERKGAAHLLHAIKRLIDDKLYDQPFRVIIGGRGELFPKLETFVQENGIGAIVSFAGFVAEEDKAKFLSQADIAVFPSISGESFGISLLEALATARGVVLGGDNPGYRAVLSPLNENRLIDPTNTKSFAHALARWLNYAAAREQAAIDQKEYVQRFDVTIVGPQVIKIYNQALRHKRNV